MRKSRLFAMIPALVLALQSAASGIPARAAEVNSDGYDISGFGAKWPEKFSKDDTVIQTELSYQSHDVHIDITKIAYDRMTGDTNFDSKLTVSDAVLLSRILAEDSAVEVTDTGLRNADVDENDELTVDDLTNLLRYLAGMIKDKDFLVDHHQAYTVADIYVRSIDLLRGAFATGSFPEKGTGKLKSIQKMAEENNAILAINCDYVEIRDNGITYRNGVMYRDKKRADIAAIFKDGTMKVLTDAEYRALSDDEKGEIWQTTSFAPGLVKNGEMLSGYRGSVYTEKHPRSGIGYYEPGHYCFVQADGRQPGYSVGVTMQEWAEFCHSLGVQEAFNMDGGGTACMAFNGKVIMRGDSSKRPLSGMIAFGKLEK